MADPKQLAATLAKVAKLLEVAKDLHDKIGDVLAEIDALLSGRSGIGEKLKALERAFDAAWCARYAPGQHGRYVWAYTKDRPHMKRLLKTLTLEDLEQRAAIYVRNEDVFYQRNRHAFGLFVSSINSHAAAGLAPEGRPVGCQHDPPCPSDQEHTRRRMGELRA